MTLLKLFRLDRLFRKAETTERASQPVDLLPQAELRTAAVEQTPMIAPAPARTETTRQRSVLSIGRRKSHPGLSKLLKRVQAASVLEIYVDDGSRVAAVLKSLAASSPTTVRYAVIDPFESADQGRTLRQYHQRTRAENVQVQIFPGPIEQGLRRVAYTLGTVDLVLLGATPDPQLSNELTTHLSRVCHPDTLVLAFDGAAWTRYEGQIGTRPTPRIAA